MGIIRVRDVAYVRFTAPDLERMRAFLLDFGLVESTGSAGKRDSLFMRGFGPAPFAHWTEKGDAGFAAIGFRASSLADLHSLASATGQDIVPLDAPGGGSLVRLTDPDGFRIEVVAGQDDTPRLDRRQAQAWNSVSSRLRTRGVKRLPKASAQIERLGHFVLMVKDFRTSEAWFKEHFGLITSDEIEQTPGVPFGAFLRCDLGEEPTDHHTLALMQTGDAPAFHHAAFEVGDIDDLVIGHDHLIGAGYPIDWGIGRHVLGSQVFSYWLDPWGNRLEHWTDGDLLTTADGSQKTPIEQLRAIQWGTIGRLPD